MTKSALAGSGPDVMPYVILISGNSLESLPFEFREAVRWLESHCTVERVSGFDALDLLLKNSSSDPWAVVALQRYKGEFDNVDAATFSRAIPLTRLIVLLGSWCEGETRTGKPLSGFERIGWCDFVPRFSGFLMREPLATTASDGEKLRSAMSFVADPTNDAVQVGVYSASYDDGLAIRHSLESLGFRTRRLLAEDLNSSNRLDVDIVVWDDAGGPRTKRADLGMATGKNIPVIATINAPRAQDVRAALLNGAHAVLAKPYRVADLVWRIESAVALPAAEEVRA